MIRTDILNTMQRVRQAPALDSALLAKATALVQAVFPAVRADAALPHDPVEAVLHMVDVALPGWSIQLTGKAMEPDGHWRCSLRETRGSDEIDTIGLGSGHAVGLALLEALLSVAEQRVKARG